MQTHGYSSSRKLGEEDGTSGEVVDATSGEVVDVIVYSQLVGSLMYLVNTRPDICYAVNQLSQAMVKPTKALLEGGEACLEVPKGHIRVWSMVQKNRGSEASRLHGCRLGRQSIRQKEHIKRDL